MDIRIIDTGMALGQPLHIDVPEGNHTINVTGGDSPITFQRKDARAADHIRQLQEERTALHHRLTSATERIRQLEARVVPAEREVTELRTILRDIRAALGVKDGADAAACAKALYENLGAVQARCSELLDECRGWRRLLAIEGRSLKDPAMCRVLGSIVAERYRQDLKWNPIGAKDLDMPDGTSEAWSFAADTAKRACDLAAQEGHLTHRHILWEEVLEAIAETDQEKLRKELVQVGAVCAKWVQVIDMRAARVEDGSRS